MNKHARALGKIGGKVKSEAKAKAVRENGKLGGRPRLTNKDAATVVVEDFNEKRFDNLSV